MKKNMTNLNIALNKVWNVFEFIAKNNPVLILIVLIGLLSELTIDSLFFSKHDFLVLLNETIFWALIMSMMAYSVLRSDKRKSVKVQGWLKEAKEEGFSDSLGKIERGN